MSNCQRPPVIATVAITGGFILERQRRNTMSVEVNQVSRPKRRSPVWTFRVTHGDKVVFDCSWVSLRFVSKKGALWLARLVENLVQASAFFGAPGHRLSGGTEPCWKGNVGDNWSVEKDGLYAHAEHCEGPMRGGMWYCRVTRCGETIFHTLDLGICPRDGVAARWLCELVFKAVTAGVWGNFCGAE